MPKTKTVDPNAAYRKRASRRNRTIGPDALSGLALGQLDAMMTDRARAGRKQYRWTDLQGTDRQEMLRLVRDCAMAAMTPYEMAETFKVTVATLQTWIARDPEFAIAMRLCRDLADDRVEKALFHRAVGYTYAAEEVKITEDGRVHRAPVVKHVAPDVGAAMFWLKNRRPDLWREKVDVGGGVDVNVTDKAQDPRTLAMAVLDTLQKAIYDKLPPTIEAVAETDAPAYADADLENMSPEAIEALFATDQED